MGSVQGSEQPDLEGCVGGGDGAVTTFLHQVVLPPAVGGVQRGQIQDSAAAAAAAVAVVAVAVAVVAAAAAVFTVVVAALMYEELQLGALLDELVGWAGPVVAHQQDPELDS